MDTTSFSEGWLLGAFFEVEGAHSASDALQACVRRLQQQGVRVGGLLQRQSRYANGQKRLELLDVASGQALEISQNLGGASDGCCINPQALAQASAMLRQALEGGQVELLCINRYGWSEADGGGFAAEFAQAAQAGVPVITAVGAKQRAAWTAFAGELAQALPLDAEEAAQVCLRRLGKDTD
ncbi:MAG: DUF2478 domain-containing protein [Ottowia sp.]|nr:DUF2478 domain-containing protein [Ottowia sp.]